MNSDIVTSGPSLYAGIIQIRIGYLKMLLSQQRDWTLPGIVSCSSMKNGTFTDTITRATQYIHGDNHLMGSLLKMRIIF